MKRLVKIIIVVVVVLAGLYYAVVTPSVSFRYRLTVNVDVNGVTHTGSGVVGVTYQSFRNWVIKSVPLDWASQFHGSLKGYAITVDLGNRGVLLVVNSIPFLRNPRGYETLPYGLPLDLLPFAAYDSSSPRRGRDFPAYGPPSEIIRHARLIGNAKPMRISIPVKYLPMMVHFTDINNRHSAEDVDPRDLAAAIGPGVRLGAVTFELTHDPITPMPSIWPAWLKSQLKSQRDGVLRFASQTTPGKASDDGVRFYVFEGGPG